MSTKLSQKLERINASMARIREKTNLPNAVIEDVATAVEQLGTSGGEDVKTNIYKVASIEERNAITDMVEGDMCVVHTSTMANMQVTDSVTAITFPATVVLPEALTDYIFTSLRDADRTVDIMVDGSDTRCRISIMMDSDYLDISYTSTDGITYTRTDTYAETIEFSSPVSCAYPEEWNDLVGYFLQVGGVSFDGLFEYKDSAWGYAKIGISTTPDYVYTGKDVYTNSGKNAGTLTEDATDTFDDVNARVYAEIQEQYNAMPVVAVPASADNLYSGKNMYTIPVKGDGTPLLDTSATTYMYATFSYCKNLLYLPKIDTSKVTSMQYTFRDCNKLKTIAQIDTSKVTDMRWMFCNCSSLETIPLLDTSSCVTMQEMFEGCKNLKSIPLINTSKVNTMRSMFASCSSLTTIPLLSTGSVTDMSSMFGGCSSLTTIPLLNTGSVTNMNSMFSYCSSLTTIPLLNTSNVTTMQYMFQSCENLETVPVLDTSKVTSLYQAFDGCKSLKSVPMLNTSANKSMYGVCRGCSSITSMPQWDTSKVNSWFLAFDGCTNLVDFPVLSMASAGEMQNAFRGCPNLSDQSLENIMKSCITKGKLPYAKTASYLGLSAEQGERLKTLPSYSSWAALGWSV